MTYRAIYEEDRSGCGLSAFKEYAPNPNTPVTAQFPPFRFAPHSSKFATSVIAKKQTSVRGVTIAQNGVDRGLTDSEYQIEIVARLRVSVPRTTGSKILPL
jgi:hypothetical protein